MRIAAVLLATLLVLPVAPAALEAGPHPEGHAHFASDGARLLDEAALTAPVPYGLRPQADHAITVHLADHPLLERSSVRLVYAVEGQDPATAGTQAPMALAGTTSDGELRFTAILRPSDLQGPTATPESLVRFLVKYRIATEQTDAGPAAGYRYVRDGAGPRALDLSLDGQPVKSVPPGGAVVARVQITDASLVQTADLDIIADGFLHSTRQLHASGFGQWSTTIETGGLPRGLYSLRVRSTDSAGNQAAATFADRLVVGTQNPTALPGASHTARDLAHLLQQQDLAGPGLGGLQRGDAHELAVLVDTSLPARVLDVRLHYTVDGAPPTLTSPGVPMTLTASGAASNAFTATLQPHERAAAGLESRVRYIIAVSSPYFPTRSDDNGGQGYRYVDDGQAPALSAPLYNGHASYAGDGRSTVTIRVPAQDGSRLAEGRLDLLAGLGVAKSVRLLPADGGLAATLPNGFGLPRGTYTARVEVPDAAGNLAAADYPDTVHVADGPPGTADRSDAVTVTDGTRTLHQDELDGQAALDGLPQHLFHITVEAPQGGEQVAVDLQYDVAGRPPGAHSAKQRMDRAASTPETWAFQIGLDAATLRGTASPEHRVAFRFVIQSSLFGTRTEPPAGFYEYLWDAQAPRIDSVLLNQKAAAVVQPTTPLEVAVPVVDGAGLDEARFQILDGAQVLLDRLLLVDSSVQRLALPAGAALAPGSYDVRILARDAVGHEAVRLVPGALRIDASAPGVASVLLNDAARVEVGPSRPIHAAVRLDEQGASSVRLEFVDAGGVAQRPLQLQPRDASTWAGVLSSGLQVPSGAYQVRVTVQDEAGNQKQHVTPYPAVIVDATPPSLYTDDVRYAEGTKQAARVGDAVQVRVGAAEANTLTSVHIQVGPNAVAMTPAGGALYRHTFPAPASSGPASYTVTAVDQAGNVGTASLVVPLDNQPPVIKRADALYEPGSGNTVSTGEAVRLAALATDEHTGVERLMLDATKINAVAQVIDFQREPGSSLWETTVQVLAPAGTYSLPVVARDEAHNAATRSVTVVVRNEGPAITELLVNGKDSLYARPGAALRIEAHVATAEQPATFNATISTPTGLREADLPLAKSGPRSFTAPVTVALPEGRHRVEAVVVDQHGRSAHYEDPDGRLVIDGTAPSLEDFSVDTGISSPDATRPKAVFGSPIELRATLTDGSPLQVSVTASGPGGPVAVDLADPTASHTYAGSLKLEAVGLHTLRLVARDAVGFVTEAIREVDVIAGSAQAPGAVQNLRQVGDPGSARPTFAWDPPAGAAVAGYAVAVDGAPGGAITSRQNTHQASPLAAGLHVVAVRAIGSQGNPGPVTELAFHVAQGAVGQPTPVPPTPPPSSTPSPPPAAPAWSSPGTPSEVHATPTLTWTTAPGIQCVQVQASLNAGPFTDVEACSAAGRTSRLDTLGAKDGDNVTVRGRAYYTNATWGPWQHMATYRLTSPAATTSPEPGALRLRVDGGNGTSAYALVYAENGTLVAQVPLTADGRGGYTALYPVPEGNYTVEYHVLDEAGNDQATKERVRVLGDPEPASKRSSGLLLGILLVAVCAVALGIVLILRRRRKKQARAQAPQPGSAPTARPIGKPGKRLTAPEADGEEERGIETKAAGPRRRVLAERDRAGVGPQGTIRLFKEP